MAQKLFLLTIFIQIILWVNIKDIKPYFIITNIPPAKADVDLFSIGDKQFFFREKNFELQFMGDSYNITTPLKDYNYSLLYKWFIFLDEIDKESDLTPSLAGYYYSMTQYHPDVKYIIEYLDEHTKRREAQKWWWLMQASYLAKYKLKDLNKAVYFAKKLNKIKTIPIWAQQSAAFIYEEMGENEAAYDIIKNIIDKIDEIPQHEINFMHYFVKDRLKKMNNELEQRSNYK